MWYRASERDKESSFVAGDNGTIKTLCVVSDIGDS